MPVGANALDVETTATTPVRDAKTEASKDVRITVNLAAVVNVMRGGIGASWHAIEAPIPVSEIPHPVFKLRSHGGSGWGAYPPAEDDAAWAQIERHARWLGLDWNRVELEQRIYEPERGQFSWDSPEMRILYRILDICERNKADVFLQQMWGNVKWNTFPEWREDAVTRVHSGPLSMDDFGEGLATLVEHLVKARGYTCIRWLCINNEPNGKWAWWEKPPDELMPLKPGLAAVRKALDARGLSLPLSGPDLTDGVPPLKPERFDFLDLLGALDFHSYDENFDWLGKRQMARIDTNTGEWQLVPSVAPWPMKQMIQFDKNTADWASWAHQNHKPFFMSEFGTLANGLRTDQPGPDCYQSALKDAEWIVRRINEGVDGFNRWSFLNRGDLDGQWQFIDTWDRKNQKLLTAYAPHPNTYFVLGLLTRFTAKHSAVLACAVDGGRVGEWPRVFAAMLRSPQGKLTLAVVNDAPTGMDVNFQLRSLASGVILHRYAVSAKDRDRADLLIDPRGQFALSPTGAAFQDRLEPMSVTVYSTYNLAHGTDGVIADEAGKP